MIATFHNYIETELHETKGKRRRKRKEKTRKSRTLDTKGVHKNNYTKEPENANALGLNSKNMTK